MAQPPSIPPRHAPGLIGLHDALPQPGGPGLEGVDEETWLDVICQMDEVYSQLVADEIELEEKNAELERSQQFIFSLLSAMSDVLIACDDQGRIEETNAALRELVGSSDADLRSRAAATRWSTCWWAVLRPRSRAPTRR